MFSLNSLKNESKIYVLGIINRHNSYKYTKIDYFDINYNNELINPFLDKLIDMKQPIYDCKYIDWYECHNQYINTKYNKYFEKWIKQYLQNIHIINEAGKLSTTYKDRDDYLTISILYDIYNIDYLNYVYNDIPINLFNYLKEDVYVYEIPIDAKKYIRFDENINSLNETKTEIKDIDEIVFINNTYRKHIEIYIIDIRNRKKYLYKNF